jgi:hypothetical protein
MVGKGAGVAGIVPGCGADMAARKFGVGRGAAGVAGLKVSLLSPNDNAGALGDGAELGGEGITLNVEGSPRVGLEEVPETAITFILLDRATV